MQVVQAAGARADVARLRGVPCGGAAGVRVKRRSSTPGLAIARDSAAEALARALTGDNETRAVAYAAEAGLFQQAGMPAIICGPGSIEQAHQPDEYVSLDQLARCQAFMEGLARVEEL